jgi:choline dehydrogenase-like flavoprotein
VVDAYGRTHDVANLFISDGSTLSTPGSANPTLTIVALALRQAEYISREMSASNL